MLTLPNVKFVTFQQGAHLSMYSWCKVNSDHHALLEMRNHQCAFEFCAQNLGKIVFKKMVLVYWCPNCVSWREVNGEKMIQN